MENIVLTEIVVAVRRCNRLLKRIVAIQNGYTNPSFIKTIISEDADYHETELLTNEDIGYLYWTE